MQTFRIKNSSGGYVKLTDYGARIMEIGIPVANGVVKNVVAGYPEPEDYLHNKAFMGCTVGRYANRIAKARFILDGKEYLLTPNDGKNSLHGGLGGFHARLWSASQYDNVVVFSHTSRDGEEGFPGELSVKVKYTWRDDNVLIIDFIHTCDRKSVVSLTNHSYFNMGNRKIEDLELQINSSAYLEIDSELIPTGNFIDVEDSVMNFRVAKGLGERSYDNCFVIDKAEGVNIKYGTCSLAATLRDRISTREVKIYTDMPGIQLYTGNQIGVALECQFLPDSPNHSNFPSVIRETGVEYRERIVYEFH